MSFTTLENVKQYINIKNNTDDTLLSNLILSVEQLFKTYMSRDIIETDYTEILNGNGNKFITVNNTPINSINSIIINDKQIDINKAIFDNIMIVLKENIFEKGMLNCVISYNAGLRNIPKDLQQAANEMVGIKYKQIQHLDQTSKTIQTETISYIQQDIPDFIKIVLNNYRKVF